MFAAEVSVVLADIAGVMREVLLALSTAAGLVVRRQMMEGELAGSIGAKHAKLGPDRVGNWHGTTTGQVVLGGRKVTVERPEAFGRVPVDPERVGPMNSRARQAQRGRDEDRVPVLLEQVDGFVVGQGAVVQHAKAVPDRICLMLPAGWA